MTGQIAFDLPVKPALGRADFFVSPANALAVRALESPDWPLGRMILTGPEGAGKTHLAHVWAAETQAAILAAAALTRHAAGALPRSVVVEDVPQIGADRDAERALLHLLNWQTERGGRVLMTGRGVPARWPIALPDLASRIAAAPVAVLDALDDALLSALLVKLFADRQLRVAPPAIAYLVRRIERRFAAAEAVVAELDARALAEARPITRALAAEILDKDGTAGA